jgi:hypothetical protein
LRKASACGCVTTPAVTAASRSSLSMFKAFPR